MSLDHARHYLHRVLPWTPGAYVNLHWTVPNPKFDPTKPVGNANKDKFLNGNAFQDVEAVIKQLAYLQGRPNTRDIYVCMSAQAMAETKSYKTVNGGSFLSAVRLQDNVVGLRSLFLDLDVKPADPLKAYPSTLEAITELKRFIGEVGLPVPTIVVASGTGGMHVYWVMDQTLTREEWQPLANALAEATRRHGLRVDTQCTVDSVRLLRVPGTVNHKHNPPLPVMLGVKALQPGDYPVGTIRSALTPYIGATVHTLPTAGVAARPAKVGLNDELAGGISSANARPIDLDTVATSCGFIREGIDKGGATFDQPLWNLATLVSTFGMGADGSDGRAQSHRMARGHKGYTQESTDALYDRKAQEKEDRNLGWPSCSAISNAGCVACTGCALRTLGKSPLSFGKPYTAPVVGLTGQAVQSTAGLNQSTVQTLAPAITPLGNSDLPTGYILDANGIVCRLVPLPDGTHTMKQVASYPVHSAWVQSNPWTLHFITRLGNSTHETQISIQTQILQSRDFAKTLAAQGIMVGRLQTQELQEFLMAWITKLQNTKDAVIASAPYGWSISKGKYEGFVYAGRVWGDGFDKPAASPDPVTEMLYRPRGDLQPWLDAAAYMTAQKRGGLDAILASSFGSPLMQFTGHSGVVVSTHSQQSGIGKTTMMHIAQAVWGHPTKAKQGLDDTQNSVIGKVGTLRSLPMFWDELKDQEANTKFVKLTFQMSSGKEKSRMNHDSTQRDPGTWKTMLISASNESLYDSIQRNVKTTEAGILRVFEFQIPPSLTPSQDTSGYVSRMVGKLDEHYGAAGLLYAKFLGKNYARVEKEVSELQDILTTKLAAPNEERFWIAAMTCILMGARYSNELNLTTIDEGTLLNFVVGTLKKLRLHRKTTVVDINNTAALSSVFQQFLSIHRAKGMLITDTMPQGQGRPNYNQCKILNDPERLDRIVIRFALDQKIMLISQGAFRDWLNLNKYPPSSVIDSMKQNWLVQENVVRNLGAGTRLGIMKEKCIEIDFTGSGFNGLHDLGV